ncbi:MAG: winged helix-turn-helix transcriptional regulator [Cyclobacteriaceae bacterium]|nr:winged helix-turn-helix transcriptional regulator [Cyclobacteriaceae bacterium]
MKATSIARVREFNRFYTRILGLLDKGILQSSFTLPEARVLYELNHLQPCSAREVALAIGMDKGYLSRILKSFARRGFVATYASQTDARVSQLTLTAKGMQEFNKINMASVNQIRQLFSALSETKIEATLAHMQAIKDILQSIPS